MSLDQQYAGEVEDWSDDDLGVVDDEPGFQWPAEEYEPDGLERIRDRMDEIAAQQAALAEQLQGDWSETDDDEYDDDEYDVKVPAPDVMDLIEGSLDSREAEYDAIYAVEERDQAFEDLRDDIPELTNERFAMAAVGEAVEMCRDQGREDLIDTPTFVGLVQVAAQSLLIQSYEARAREQAQYNHVELGSAQGARPEEDGRDDAGDRVVAAAQAMRPRI